MCSPLLFTEQLPTKWSHAGASTPSDAGGNDAPHLTHAPACSLVTPPPQTPFRLSIADPASALWLRRHRGDNATLPLQVQLSQRYTNIAPGEAVQMLPLPCDADADVDMAPAACCSAGGSAGSAATLPADGAPAPPEPEPAPPGLRRRPHFLDAAAAASALPVLAEAAESESDAQTSSERTTKSGRKRTRDAEAAAAITVTTAPAEAEMAATECSAGARAPLPGAPLGPLGAFALQQCCLAGPWLSDAIMRVA